MSDFRKFCIAYFIATCGLVAGENHGWWPPTKDGAAGVMLLGSVLAALIVIWFGKRAPEKGYPYDRA